MVFKGFRINVALRLGAFVVLSTAAIWGFANTDWEVTPIVSALLGVVVLFELIRYVESINRELSSFLDFVTHDDFSASFPIGDKGRVFNELEFAYKRLLDKYRNLNEAREINHRYLESLVEHVSVALICLDDKGRVTLMNRQAKRLFKTPQLHDLKSLWRIDRSLPAELEALGDGDRILMRLQIEGEDLQLALYVTEFELLNRSYKLISFQNIRDELEQREADFSEKLISVLTHEIMNSVTPIIALSKVVEESLSGIAAAESGSASGSEPEALDSGPGAPDTEPGAPDPRRFPEMDDLLRSVASIQSRGDGLLRFVQAYRSLTSLPRPNRRLVGVAGMLEQTVTLLAPAAEHARVALESRIDDSALAIDADPEQIQQVLINLVNNALEAVDGRPGGRIVLSAAKDHRERTTIRVTDNGPGIAEDQIDNIFVPFFTTKQRGSGVGLSVSRQIMRLHHGQIAVKSGPGQGTEFSLQFRESSG